MKIVKMDVAVYIRPVIVMIIANVLVAKGKKNVTTITKNLISSCRFVIYITNFGCSES